MSFIEERLTICKNCAIYNTAKQQCSAYLWIDPSTNTAYSSRREGAYKGCGCYIPSKVQRESNVCPANKW